MYIYTHGKQNAKNNKTRSEHAKNKNNTHKHLFILHLIHFAVQPLAALCISLYREKERMTGKRKVNAALYIVSSFQNSSKKELEKSADCLSNIQYSFVYYIH